MQDVAYVRIVPIVWQETRLAISRDFKRPDQGLSIDVLVIQQQIIAAQLAPDPTHEHCTVSFDFDFDFRWISTWEINQTCEVSLWIVLR
jgi:hypothetical protein